jgi:ketosteroid isomerase-like protein
MSQENLDIVRRNNDAYNARDVGAVLATLSESVTFRSRFSAMDSRAYHGHEDMRRYFADLEETWSRYEMQLERMVEVGSKVVGLFHLHAVGRESGVEVEEEPGVVFTVEAGKVVAIDSFPSQAQALESVGLSGDPKA